MSNRQCRPALVSMKQGRVAPVEKLDIEFDDADLPVVDPASILRVGENPANLSFTTDMMELLSDSADVNKRWLQLLQSLRDREGTVEDVTAEFLAYEDQEMLRLAKTGILDVKAIHVHTSVRQRVAPPITVCVESWLRDAVTVADRRSTKLAAVKLWCLHMANATGGEAIRDVLRRMEIWTSFDVTAASCSGQGNSSTAATAVKRAFAYYDNIWADVIMAVDVCSLDILWDWRRSEKECRMHPGGKCPGRRSRPTLPPVARSTCTQLVKDPGTGKCVNCGLWDHGGGSIDDDDEELWQLVQDMEGEGSEFGSDYGR